MLVIMFDQWNCGLCSSHGWMEGTTGLHLILISDHCGSISTSSWVLNAKGSILHAHEFETSRPCSCTGRYQVLVWMKDLMSTIICKEVCQKSRKKFILSRSVERESMYESRQREREPELAVLSWQCGTPAASG